MGEYDRIIKENIEAIFLPLLGKILDLSIKSTSEIKDKLSGTIEREPDFLKRIIDHNDEAFILHLEFQTMDDPEMVYRMAEYKALLQRRYKTPVKQFVIYLGMGRSSMQTTLPASEQITGFDLRNIHDLSADSILTSEVPEEIILAVLADFGDAQAEEVIKRIVNKLQQAATDETTLRRAVKQLLILSRLRKLQKVAKQTVRNMPITYDITQDDLYLEGAESRMNKMILNSLKIGIPIEQIAAMAEVDVAYVLKLKEEASDNSEN